MLDHKMQEQLKNYLALLTRPVEIIASLDDQAKSSELAELLRQIASFSHWIHLNENGQSIRRPSFTLSTTENPIHIEFAGIPLGHEFNSLVLALLQVGGHPIKASTEQITRIQSLQQELYFETYVSLSCQNCPDVVQALNLMAVVNPHIHHTMVDGALFQNEIQNKQIMAVPSIYLNGNFFAQGRMLIDEILNQVDHAGAARIAETLSQQIPFDVLVIGGGPAGATAAIYAARKGIRTGLVAEKIGGQVLDTLTIENFISIQSIQGPQLAKALAAHLQDYDIEVITTQSCQRLTTAKTTDQFHQISLASGAVLQAKTIIIATGAHWKQLNVPGEQQYAARGVAYCPHCDGPLFKGKSVAVIGGGNSGVEAAIDLANIVAHVTLLEFGPQLRADAVLQRKLLSLPNVTILTNAQTTEVIGDGQKVTGLTYCNRLTDNEIHLELAGIFIQIGLIANSQWLKNDLKLSQHGEIVIDEYCRTSQAGIFAAGDVTTVPYKQIVIALGEGAKASLSAFDYLIRHTEHSIETAIATVS